MFGSKVKVDAVSKVAELELAEKEKMRDKVNKIIKHGCNVFINRWVLTNLKKKNHKFWQYFQFYYIISIYQLYLDFPSISCTKT